LVKNNEVHGYDTRNNTKYYIERRKKEIGRRSIAVCGIAEYNKVPDNIKKMNVSRFKIALYKHVKNTYPLK